jgi:hypothetical protein
MLIKPQRALETRPPQNTSPVAIGAGALVVLILIFGAYLVWHT